MIVVKKLPDRKNVRKTAKKIAKFYQFDDNIKIIIKISKIANYAEAQWVNKTKYIVHLNKKWYKKASRHSVMMVLAHELTHVNQFISGKLTFASNKQDLAWGNEEFRQENYFEYLMTPWEMEARAMEMVIWHYIMGEKI